jgi:hypothetical protein
VVAVARGLATVGIILIAVGGASGELSVSCGLPLRPREGGGLLLFLLVAAAMAAALPLGAEAAPAAGSPGSRTVRTLKVARAPLGDRPTALAFVDEGRLLLLTADEVVLLRLDGAAVGVASRLVLPGPRRAARASAGLIAFDRDSSAAWVLTNHRGRAHLVDIDGARLTARAEAEALPWPGSSTGLRFREGTTWIEGEIDGLGSGPFLAVGRPEGTVGVSSEGELLLARSEPPGSALASDDERLVVGPTLAAPWPGWIAASDPRPPGASDDLLLLEERGGRFVEAAAIEVDGAIRAVASRTVGSTAHVALSVESASGPRLLLLDLERRTP